MMTKTQTALNETRALLAQASELVRTLTNQADLLAEEAEREKRPIPVQPKVGSTVSVDVRWRADDTKTYTYVAYRCEDGHWTVTGQSKKNYTWEEFVKWMYAADATGKFTLLAAWRYVD